MLILTASAGHNSIEIGSDWTTIGRSDQNRVVITDGSVSSRHGEVRSEGTLLHIRDLGSSNGTFVNGQRVTTATLQPGDSLNLGQVALVWRPPSAELAPSGDAAAAASPPPIPVPVPLPPALPVANGCHNHPTIVSPWICPKCQERWCGDCVTKPNVSALKGKVFCPTCKSLCQPLYSSVLGSPTAAPVAVPLSSRTFPQMIGHAFSYPLKPFNIAAILTGSVFFALGSLLGRRGAAGFSFGLLGLGILVAFFVKVIQSSAQGEGEVPAWSDFSDITNEIRVPAIQFIFTSFMLFMPVILAWILMNLSGPLNAWLDYRDTGEMPLLTAIVMKIAFALKIVISPAVYLVVAMHESVEVMFHPRAWSRAITVPRKDYAILVAMYVLFDFVLIAGAKFMLGLAPIPLLTPLLDSFVWLYLTTVEFRLVGLFYYANRREIGWF